MRKTTIFILFFSLLIGQATMAWSQPAAVKRAAKSVFSVTTFKDDGSIHGSGYGVFTGKADEGIAMWNLFDGAKRAVVVDAQGRSHEVDVILGVSELYDICQFRVKNINNAGLPTITTNVPATSAYLVGYDIKKAPIKLIKPEKVEKFMTSNNYYIFKDIDISNTDLGNPIVNVNGQLMGIMQRHKNGGQAFVTDVRIINTFKTNGLSLNDRSMQATGIRPALPTDEQQAMLMLMMAAQQGDSARYEAYITDFINLFPTSHVGYQTRATRLIQQRELAKADDILMLSLKNAAQKDQAYCDYAQAMFRAVAFKTDTTYTQWSFSRAIQLAQKAYEINPQPIYRHLQAQILYAEGDYQKALDIYSALQKTPLGKNGEVYYEAAQCKMALNAPKTEIISLLDSAATIAKGPAAAPYVLARGRYYDNAGEYRKAFTDYLTYDTLVNYRGTHDFYYTKFKCEMKLRQYQLALNDIAHAIVLNRTEPTYYAEMGNLQLQVNKLEDAVRTCDMGLAIAQEYTDLYIIKGIALCEQSKRMEGLKALQKAHELGDSRAQKLIDKYTK